MNATTWKYGLQTNQVFEVDSGEQICSVVRDMFTREQYVSHGHLLAASPELLAALEDLLSVVNVRIDDPRTKQFDAARAAIQKAKGLAI